MTTQARETGDRTPRWWRRDHPTFTALSGFFAGMVLVIVVPGVFAGVLRLLFPLERAEELFGFVLVALVVPLGLLLSDRTRRFGGYLVLGMVLTALVVLGVAALVLLVMLRSSPS